MEAFSQISVKTYAETSIKNVGAFCEDYCETSTDTCVNYHEDIFEFYGDIFRDPTSDFCKTSIETPVRIFEYSFVDTFKWSS